MNKKDDDIIGEIDGRGLGASSDIGNVNSRGLVASSGTGPEESHSRGWCAPSLPRLPVLPSPPQTRHRGGEAPPGGRPHNIERSNAVDSIVTKPAEYM